MSVTRVRPHDCGENYYLVLRGRAYEARHIERTISRQLISALNEAAHDGNTTKMRKLVDNLIAKAIEGGVPAIKEILDRVEGEVPQAMVNDDDQGPIKLVVPVAGRIPPSPFGG